MQAYYNEFDPAAAAWLRELIKAGLIVPGVVDERSIEDVAPNDLAGFTQCHFFAGIGVWSYALRQAGWPDDRPVWTGSCPCQPFSAAGKGNGFADERHLWPAFNHLIAERRPPVVFGEQVASKAADDWIDLVHADLEAVGYAFGCVPFPSAGVGAPHIRDRTYWVADADEQQRNGGGNVRPGGRGESANGRAIGGVGNNNNIARLEGFGNRHQTESGRLGAVGSVAEAGESGGVADAEEHGQQGKYVRGNGEPTQRIAQDGALSKRPGQTNGFWRDADWLFCRDGKFRPVEPGTFPLAHGAAARVGRLRGYGNAINAEAAKAFIESFIQQSNHH